MTYNSKIICNFVVLPYKPRFQAETWIRATEIKIEADTLTRGKAKTKIHARYPFLGGGTHQPPVVSVLYLQVWVLAGGRW